MLFLFTFYRVEMLQNIIYNVFQNNKTVFYRLHKLYSETLNNEYIEWIHQMSYSSLSDNGMLQIFSFLIK